MNKSTVFHTQGRSLSYYLLHLSVQTDNLLAKAIYQRNGGKSESIEKRLTGGCRGVSGNPDNLETVNFVRQSLGLHHLCIPKELVAWKTREGTDPRGKA